MVVEEYETLLRTVFHQPPLLKVVLRRVRSPRLSHRPPLGYGVSDDAGTEGMSGLFLAKVRYTGDGTSDRSSRGGKSEPNRSCRWNTLQSPRE